MLKDETIAITVVLAEPGHWKAYLYANAFQTFWHWVLHFSFFFVCYIRSMSSPFFCLLALTMLVHVMLMHISRHHGDTVSPRTWYHYLAILAMIIREYLSIDHYSITTDAGAVTFTTRLSLA
jgi:hypothetical protein